MEGRSLNSLMFTLLGLTIVNTVGVSGQKTRVGFYSRTCPRAESIVKSTVRDHLKSDPSLAAGLLRLHFHDCFVQGCDASVLIEGPQTERTALPNLSLKGFEVINDAKTQLEAVCPGVVSCADILALATRDSVDLVINSKSINLMMFMTLLLITLIVYVHVMILCIYILHGRVMDRVGKCPLDVEMDAYHRLQKRITCLLLSTLLLF